jgi:hypothetical protein
LGFMLFLVCGESVKLEWGLGWGCGWAGLEAEAGVHSRAAWDHAQAQLSMPTPL